MLNHVNHEAAHAMIQALSMTEEGSKLIKGLEDIRYYHKAADVYDLGYGGVLVEAFDMDSDGDCYWEGSVLIPSTRDRLIYESAAYQDEPVQGALFWGWGYDDDCIVIPRVLGEWAAECALAHATKMKTVHSPAECRPVACAVNSLTQMAVTAPVDQVNLPGLTKDKWAQKKAAEANVERRDTQYDFPSLILPGYLQLCPTVYGVNINRIDCLDVWPTPFEDCTPETICDEKSWSYREPVVLRAACQIMSKLKHWEYFDKCSPLQCAKHLFANDFRPVDL
jgi:hypothetical protein|nr:MAG TPA: hypothetical protein [Caudoviricetes sp.]